MEEFSAQAIISNLEILRGNRTGLNEKLEQVASFLSPAKFGAMTIDRSGSMSRNEPEKRPRQIVCDFAQEAANTFTRGLFSNLFPPSVRWFSYSLSYPEQKNLPEAFKRYFASASQAAYDLLYATNWTTEMSEICEECPSTGTVTMSVVFDPERILKFKCHHLSNIYCTSSDDTTIDTVYEVIPLTARQALNRFGRSGDQLGKRLLDDAKSGDVSRSEKLYTIIHFVTLNPNRKFRTVERNGRTISEPVQGPEGKRFLSFYVEKEEKILIRRGGFDHNPYTVGRIDNMAFGVYGFSPGLRALRTMKLLNKTYAIYINALDAALRPSVIVDSCVYDGISPEFYFDPGSVNLYNSGGGKFNPPQFVTPPSNLPGGLEFINQGRQLLDRFFFRDLFTIIQQMNEQSGRQRTAREIQELVSEKNSQILPLVARFLDELVTPVLKTVFRIIFENTSLFGPPPSGLEDFLGETSINLQYFSPLALAAKATKIQGTIAAIEDIMPLLQIKPEVLDMIDLDKLFTDMLEVRGANPDHILTMSKVQQIRKDREKQMQQQQLMEQAAKLAGGQNLNETPQPGSLAAQLVGGA